VKDALLLVDVLNDFRHQDGDRLLESFRMRHEGMERALSEARSGGVPVIYAQDSRGVWDGDRSRLGPKSLGKTTRFVVDHAPCPVLLVWPESAPDVATIPPPPHHPSPPGH